MVKVRQLEILRAMMATGSVTETARALNTSQPAVSKTISAIEDELGVRLFDRIRGKLQPTRLAFDLMPTIERIFSDLASLRDAAAAFKSGSAGQVSIAAPATITGSLIVEAIAGFRGSVFFNVVTCRSPEVIEAVARNQVDLGIVQPSLDGSRVRSTNLCRGPILCVLPAGHRLADRAEIRASDLADVPLITQPQDTPTGARVRDFFREAGLQPTIAVETSQSFTACALVAAGKGLAVVGPFFGIVNAFPALVVRPLAPAIIVRFAVISSRDKPLSPMAKAFRSHLRSVAETMLDGRHDGLHGQVPRTGRMSLDVSPASAEE